VPPFVVVPSLSVEVAGLCIPRSGAGVPLLTLSLSVLTTIFDRSQRGLAPYLHRVVRGCIGSCGVLRSESARCRAVAKGLIVAIGEFTIEAVPVAEGRSPTRSGGTYHSVTLSLGDRTVRLGVAQEGGTTEGLRLYEKGQHVLRLDAYREEASVRYVRPVAAAKAA